MALDRGVTLAYAPAGERRVRLASLDFAGEVDFPLGDIPERRLERRRWAEHSYSAARPASQAHVDQGG
jgi:hypothetical protein